MKIKNSPSDRIHSIVDKIRLNLFYGYKLVFILFYRFFESLSSGYNPRNRHFDRILGTIGISSFLVFQHLASFLNNVNTVKYFCIIFFINTGCFFIVKNEIFTEFKPNKKILFVFKIVIILYFFIIQYLFYTRFVLDQ